MNDDRLATGAEAENKQRESAAPGCMRPVRRTSRWRHRHGRRPDRAAAATGRACGKKAAEGRTGSEWRLALTCATEAVWLTPNVGANRPAEAGGVSLARDSGEAAAR